MHNSVAAGLLLTVMSPVVSEARPLVFTHVTVVDPTGAPSRSDMTVTIEGDRITAVGKAVPAAQGAQVVDASGKFLIPGLWDMHSHLYQEAYLPLYVANGVTGVRLMSGEPAHQEWRRKVMQGALLGPDLVLASRLVDGPHPVHPTRSIIAGTEAEGRQTVTRVRQEGADFIKVYSLLPREAYFALADEATKQAVPFGGHVPRYVTPAEASDAGQKSIEHLGGIAFACSKLESDYPADLDKLEADLASRADHVNYYLLLRRMEAKYLKAYDPEKCAPLFARYRQNGTWQVPTFSAVQIGALLADPEYVNPRLEYVPAAGRGDPRKNGMHRYFTAADYDLLKDILAKQLEIVGAMQRAGVPLLAGTDVVPVGFSLHDELALMVEAGLSPIEALQSATINPARYFGREKELGTIAVGKRADLVLLDADPLADIHNTRKISGVISRGRLLDRAKLDQILMTVRTAGDRMSQ